MENLSHSEIIEQINKELPNWIVDIAEKYDENYSQFTKNWNLICEKLKTTPKYIIIVNDIPHIKDENPNMKIFDYCNQLVQLGYMIRRKQELMISKRGKVIPTKKMYKYMKKSPNLREFIPKSWSDL